VVGELNHHGGDRAGREATGYACRNFSQIELGLKLKLYWVMNKYTYTALGDWFEKW
jgi:hypothetical protein